jgi:hypothetical protein
VFAEEYGIIISGDGVTSYWNMVIISCSDLGFEECACMKATNSMDYPPKVVRKFLSFSGARMLIVVFRKSPPR